MTWGRFRLGAAPSLLLARPIWKIRRSGWNFASYAKERHPAKLLTLTQEIARLLDEKEQRVKKIHRLLKEQGKGNVSKAFDPT